MDDHEWLARRFEENRAHLRAVAYRMLGSTAEADDAVQDAWLRLSRSDAAAIENLRGWLTTAVARVCLNMLQSRRSRRAESLELEAIRPLPADRWLEPEDQALAADAVGIALLVVLEALTPAERVAFVLHDVFSVPFKDIAPVVGRSPVAARQLASRARRRVQGASLPSTDPRGQREVVTAFLAAARGGDFDALLSLLDPDAVVHADEAAVRMAGAPIDARGAFTVAQTFMHRSHGARPALVNGSIGAVWAPGRAPRVAFEFAIREGRIFAINLIADPERIRSLELSPVTD